MKDFLGIVIVGLIAATALPAAAQDAPAAEAPAAEAPAAGGGDATTYDFEDDLVQGDLVRPDGENLMVRRKGARESLIRIREHFISELLKSVENL